MIELEYIAPNPQWKLKEYSSQLVEGLSILESTMLMDPFMVTHALRADGVIHQISKDVFEAVLTLMRYDHKCSRCKEVHEKVSHICDECTEELQGYLDQ